MLTLFVSPMGKDTFSGRLPETNADQTDGPLASLQGARDAIRRLRTAGETPSDGVTVLLRGGDYSLETMCRLEAVDSGYPSAPIVYRACPGETPRLLGGKH